MEGWKYHIKFIYDEKFKSSSTPRACEDEDVYQHEQNGLIQCYDIPFAALASL